MSLYEQSEDEIQMVLDPASIAILSVVVMLGVNLIGSLPMTILLLDLMLTEVSSGQIELIAIFAWLVSGSVCLTAFGQHWEHPGSTCSAANSISPVQI